MHSIVNILLTLFIFTFVVTLHEFGHFMAARKAGVFVEEFAIGMGPALFSRKTKSGTVFSVRVLPIGGFCQMKGEQSEDDEEHTEENDAVQAVKEPEADSFEAQPIRKRALIVAAGPAMNFILALVLAIIVNLLSGFATLTVGGVMPGSPADKCGIEAGDTIMEVNGSKTYVFSKVSMTLLFSNPEEDIVIKYRKPSGEVQTGSTRLAKDEETGAYYLGITSKASGNIVSASKETGFGKAVGRAIANAAGSVVYFVESTIKSIVMLVTGRIGLNALSGPIGMVSVVGEVYEGAKKVGITAVLSSIMLIIVLISANLGVMNLLPIPGLDGSRLVFLGLEKVRKKPLTKKVETVVYLIGFVILIGLMVVVSIKDIIALF